MPDSQRRTRRVQADSKPPRIAFNKDLFLTALADRGATTDHQRADLLGMPPCSVRRYHDGRVIPLLSTARQIAETVGVSVEDLWPVDAKAAA